MPACISEREDRRENTGGRTEHKSVKSGDMRGGFDSLQMVRAGSARSAAVTKWTAARKSEGLQAVL
jgi:hypothetical protein